MHLLRNLICLLVIALFFSCKGKEKEIPLADFFKSQEKSGFSLSPDGKSLSYFKVEDRRQNIIVEDIATGQTRQITNQEDKNLNNYYWVSNEQLVYYKKSHDGRSTSLFIIDKEGKQERQLNHNDKSRIRILKDQLIDDKYLLVSSNRRDSTIFDVYRLDVMNGKMEMAVQNPGNITNWYTDAKARLRLAISSDGVHETLLYREDESKPFRPVLTNNFKTTLTPIAFSDDRPHIIYAISNANRDKNALVELDCSTGKESKVLFANDSLNVVDAQYSTSKKKVGFVVCETWKNKKYYLDDTVKRLYQRLEELLPQTESRIIDRDKEENLYLVRTYTEKNPGSYYLYTAKTGSLKKLSDVNPAIREEDMSEVKPISYTSRDGLTINGYLTLPKGKSASQLPLVVVPHNGLFNRSSWGFNAEVQFLASRGFAVLQVNYRGSSGYGKAFAAAGLKEWGGKINDDIEDGVRWLVKQQTVNPKRVGIYGTGFAGYLALNSLYSNPGVYRCAAANSGIINLFSYLKTIPPYMKSNLQMIYEMIGNPITEVEGMRAASPVFHADKIQVPVLIAQSTKDYWVNPGEAEQFVKEMRKKSVNVTYLIKPYADNMQNSEEDRQKYYLALEQFLEANLQ